MMSELDQNISIESVISELMNEDQGYSFVLISFDEDLIKSIVNLLLTIGNCRSLILSIVFLKDHESFRNELTQLIDGQFELIDNMQFKENQNKCIFFADFYNSILLTPSKLDFSDKVEKNELYRKNCRHVIMYNYTGTPQLNGYWQFKKQIADNTYLLSLSDWGNMCQQIPQINIPPGGEIVNYFGSKISQNWLEEIRKYLRYLLPIILGTDTYTDELLLADNMQIWVKCFIHETFNAVYGYQLLEFFGDKICSAKFVEYMIQKYPRLTQSEATEYHNQYMSKKHQYYISDDLKLSKFLLANLNVFTISNKDKTDIFESFVGALYQTCNSINSSLAEAATSNLFILIGEQFSFERKIVFGTPKHSVIQIIESLGFNPHVDFKLDIIKKYHGQDNAETNYKLKISENFANFVNGLKYTDHEIKGLNYELKFSPHEKTEGLAQDEFWSRISDSFKRADIDIRYAKNERLNIFDTILKIDLNTYNRFVDKLETLQELNGVNEGSTDLLKRVHFKSNKKDKDDTNNYVIMYLNTFKAPENSPILNSMTEFKDADQKSGNDYLDDMNEEIQKMNLAVVRTPRVGSTIGGYNFNPFQMACYNCILTFCNN